MKIRNYLNKYGKKGYNIDYLKGHLIRHGFDEKHVEKESRALKRQKLLNTSLIIALILSTIFSLLYLKPTVTGFATADTGYPAVMHSSADFAPGVGIIYQGDSFNDYAHTENIYKGKTELPIQGKQDGSVNIIDFNNDGKGDLFTTGFYTDNNKERASTDLYADLNNKFGDFVDVKNSDSCWADFDNNGFLEPVIIGVDDAWNKYFEVYKNVDGKISRDYSLGGMVHGTIECFDYDNNGWIDVLVCGEADDSRPTTILFWNDRGNLVNQEKFESLTECGLTVNDFSSKGYPDFVLSGTTFDDFFSVIYLYTNNQGSFFQSKLTTLDYKSENSISSGDFDNNGWPDFGIAGRNPNGLSKTSTFINAKGSFRETKNEFLQLRYSTILFLDYDNNGFLDVFQTGDEKLGINPITLKAQLALDLTDVENSPPSIPANLSYEETENNYLKLNWQPSTDDHTQYPFYHVRAGTDNNPNQFLSGFLSDEKGNAQLTQFKILKDPTECFFFQVKAIDGAYHESGWSEKFYVNCEIEEINETIELPEENEIIEMPAPEDESKEYIWFSKLGFDEIKYFATYEKREHYILLTEYITNKDIYMRENITVFHPYRGDYKGEILDKGSYKERILYLDRLEPGEKHIAVLKLRNDLQFNQVLPTQIDSEIYVPEESVKVDINASVRIEENKTIIEIPTKTNESNLVETGVTIKQELPKCLIEKINELAIKSGRIKASKKFKIIEEDPVIMWYFESVVDPELLKVEIANVVDENCTNQIKTEIVAKKVLAQKDEPDVSAAVLQIILPLIIIPLFMLLWGFLRKKEKETSRKRAGYFFLMMASLILLVLSIFDTLSLLPPTLDFIKKAMSWMSMILLIIYLNLADVFAGHSEEEKKNKIYRHLFNFFIITGFIFLSIKNIIYVAFETYGNERIFADMMLLLIKNSKWLETNLFFTGILFVFTSVIIAWLCFRLKEHSFAELFGRQETAFIGSKLQKLIFIFMLIVGFFIAIFSFLFDWFSIGVDSPFLLLIFILSVRGISMTKATEKPESFIKSYINLFKHRKNKFIAFSSIPIFIFIVEAYIYLAYMLFGIRNLYFEAIDVKLPTIHTVVSNANNTLPVLIIYALQILGLISAIVLAFWFWWHFFLRREKEPGEKDQTEKPRHKFLFIALILGILSFFIRPVFNLGMLENSRISGVILTLKNTISPEGLLTDFVILSAAALFFLYLFTVKKSKAADTIPYALTLIPVVAFTFEFWRSYIIRLMKQIVAVGITGLNQSFVTYINTIFLIIFGLMYSLVIFLSIYSLLGEYIDLFWEDFGHRSIYRKLVVFFFRHKITLSEKQVDEIMKRAERMQEQGWSRYVIEERLSKKMDIPEDKIQVVLRKLEFEEKEEHKKLHIDHHLHDIKSIEQLNTKIKFLYWKKGMPIGDIIESCLNNSWHQDDIAAACSYIKPKRKDRKLFKEMKGEIIDKK